MLSVTEKTFVRVVLESPQLVLVYFWAPWCGLCRFVQPLLNQTQGEWGDRLQLVEINADHNFKLANTYRLHSLPTFLLFEQGKVVQRLEGFHSREDLQRLQELVSPRRIAQSA